MASCGLLVVTTKVAEGGGPDGIGCRQNGIGCRNSSPARRHHKGCVCVCVGGGLRPVVTAKVRPGPLGPPGPARHSPFRVPFPSPLSESPFRVPFPSPLSESPIRVPFPSPLSESPFRVRQGPPGPPVPARPNAGPRLRARRGGGGQVGGVPEVLPDGMVKYARPDPHDIVEALQVPPGPP